jgi:anti-anti-sigma factor
MALTISCSVENEIAILDLEGPLTLGPSLHQLRTTVADTLRRHRLRGLIVQTARVTTADSAGLGELTLAYTTATRENCRFVVAGVNASILTMLQVTHLDGLLTLAADLPSALTLLKH